MRSFFWGLVRNLYGIAVEVASPGFAGAAYLMVPLRPAGKKTPFFPGLPPVTIESTCAVLRANTIAFASASTRTDAVLPVDAPRVTDCVPRPKSSGFGALDNASRESLARRAEIFWVRVWKFLAFVGSRELMVVRIRPA